MTGLYYFFIVTFILVAALLCLIIMIQESKSMGLGASFGGGDSSDSLFGTSTADVLKKFTAYLASIFMILCVVLSIWTAKISKQPTYTPHAEMEEVQEIDG
ncbi:MAG: preprotein translocase subunit SecG [Simkaniaceae bacterium]|nr:preprotein translocase subunit SecG [Simkaniaceae bacterium]